MHPLKGDQTQSGRKVAETLESEAHQAEAATNATHLRAACWVLGQLIVPILLSRIMSPLL